LDIIRSRASDFYINPENLNKRKQKLESRKQKIQEKVIILAQNIKKTIEKRKQTQSNNTPTDIGGYLDGIKDRFSKSTLKSVFNNDSSTIVPNVDV